MGIHTLTVRLGRLLCVGVMAAGGAASATDYYVAPWGDDGNDGKSWETAMRSPELVSDKAGATQVNIIISNGVYLLTKPIELKSEGGGCGVRSFSGNPADVVLDGQNKTNVLYTAGYTSSFRGLTIQNARYDGGSRGEGAGLGAHREWMSVRDCVFSNCWLVAQNKTLRGGAFYVGGGSTVSNVLVVGCGIENTGTTGEGEGGGCAIYGTTTTARDLVVTNCSITGPNAFGGGVFLWGAHMYDSQVVGNFATNGICGGVVVWAFDGNWTAQTATLSNVLVRANVSKKVGGGILCQTKGHTTIDSCTIADNTVLGGSNGAGIEVEAKATIRHSLIAGNVTTNVASSGNGGGIYITNGAESTTVEDCVICDNVAGYEGGAICTGDGAKAMTVSNCVLRANAAKNRYGCFSLYNVNGALITDCFVISNKAPNNSIGYVSGYADTRQEVVFRNSYFFGNTGETAQWYGNFGFANAGASAPVKIDYCTFVSNGIGGSVSYTLCPYTDNPASTAYTNNYLRNFFVTGCVLHGNKGNVPNNLTIFPDHIQHTYASSLQAEFQAPELHNLWKAVAQPVFADESSLDFSHGAGSPLIDAGPAADVPAWMGTGKRKKGPMDLGDGSYEIGQEADYGVTVRRHNARPRLCGGIPDLGCFEFFMPPGLLMILR